MRDGYQRHPATHMGMHSNPHTPVHKGYKKHTHDYTHRYTAQERARVQTHAPSDQQHTCSARAVCAFVPVHTEHINSSLLPQILVLSARFFSFFFSQLPISAPSSSSSSIKFQASVTFHISITGDSPTALPLSRSPKLCPKHQSDSRILSCAII